MSVCRRGGRALKGRVSLLRRVTEQSDGSQRAENNSCSLCTPRRQQWNRPSDCSTTNTRTRARIKPLFRPAFISKRRTVSGVRLSTFLCVNCRCCYFGSPSYSRTFYIYIPLRLQSRSLFSNVHIAILSSGPIGTQAGTLVQHNGRQQQPGVDSCCVANVQTCVCRSAGFFRLRSSFSLQ